MRKVWKIWDKNKNWLKIGLLLAVFSIFYFIFSGTAFAQSEKYGDLNNNGKSDYIFGWMDHTENVGKHYISIRVAFDLDENGYPAGGIAQMALPDSGSGWTGADNYSGGLAVGDLDNNNDPEIVFVWTGIDQMAFARIFWNVNNWIVDPANTTVNISQFFLCYTAIGDGGWPKINGIEIADLDHDGNQDLLFTLTSPPIIRGGGIGTPQIKKETNDKYIKAFWGNGIAGTAGFDKNQSPLYKIYSEKNLYDMASFDAYGHHDTALADFENDGIYDLVLVGQDGWIPGTSKMYLYRAKLQFDSSRNFTLVEFQKDEFKPQQWTPTLGESWYEGMAMGKFGDYSDNKQFIGSMFAGPVGENRDLYSGVIKSSPGDITYDYLKERLQTGTYDNYFWTSFWGGMWSGLYHEATGADIAEPTREISLADFSISALPLTQTISLGQSADYTVTISSTNDFNSAVNLSVTDAQGGTDIKFYDLGGNEITDIIPPANGSIECIMRVSTNLSTPVTTHTITATGTSDSLAHPANPVYLEIAKVTIKGDIYSGNYLNLGGVYVEKGSVASAKNTVTVSGTEYKIPSYDPLHLVKWELAKQKMRSTIYRLIDEYKNPYTVPSKIIGTTFNLNPKSGFPNDLEFSSKPEGQVWYRDGNLTLKDVTFRGKGTIIVKGNLNIEGDISYSTDDPNASLGIIVIKTNYDTGKGGDIVISNTVNNLQGAYYTTGDIKIKKGISSGYGVFKAIFVGNNISLDRSNLIIEYEQRSGENPPGFRELLTPAWKEVSP